MSKTNKPKVKLTGTDGNVFSIISKISAALKKNGTPEQAKQFTNTAFAVGSYDEVLQLAMKYCDVS